MNKINCENILMAKMAQFDGEDAEVSAEEVNSHLASCESCRREFEDLRMTGNFLKNQIRRELRPNLWTAIEVRIAKKNRSPVTLKPFVLIGIFLFAYKLLEIYSGHDFGWALQLLPLVFLLALLVFIRENPFKLNAELNLEEQ